MRYDKLDLIALQDPNVAAGRRAPNGSASFPRTTRLQATGYRHGTTLDEVAARMRSRDRWAALRVPVSTDDA